jgi:hypothetical protein
MSDKYQREIEEILEATGETPVPDGGKRRGARGGNLPKVNLNQGKAFWRFTSGKLFLVSVGLLVTALIMRSVGVNLVGFFAWAGIILFILAYALFFVKPSNNTEKRWRGRPVDDDDDSERLRRWRGR